MKIEYRKTLPKTSDQRVGHTAVFRDGEGYVKYKPFGDSIITELAFDIKSYRMFCDNDGVMPSMLDTCLRPINDFLATLNAHESAMLEQFFMCAKEQILATDNLRHGPNDSRQIRTANEEEYNLTVKIISREFTRMASSIELLKLMHTHVTNSMWLEAVAPANGKIELSTNMKIHLGMFVLLHKLLCPIYGELLNSSTWYDYVPDKEYVLSRIVRQAISDADLIMDSYRQLLGWVADRVLAVDNGNSRFVSRAFALLQVKRFVGFDALREGANLINYVIVCTDRQTSNLVKVVSARAPKGNEDAADSYREVYDMLTNTDM